MCESFIEGSVSISDPVTIIDSEKLLATLETQNTLLNAQNEILLSLVQELRAIKGGL